MLHLLVQTFYAPRPIPSSSTPIATPSPKAQVVNPDPYRPSSSLKTSAILLAGQGQRFSRFVTPPCIGARSRQEMERGQGVLRRGAGALGQSGERRGMIRQGRTALPQSKLGTIHRVYPTFQTCCPRRASIGLLHDEVYDESEASSGVFPDTIYQFYASELFSSPKLASTLMLREPCGQCRAEMAKEMGA
jgi:hypothetical protein